MWAALIGGNGGGYHWCREDWKHLAEGMNTLASQFGIQWVITTSRRTGSDAESILRSYLDRNHLADVVWYSTNPERVIGAYLGLSERVFVTEESISMLSEGVVARRPLYAISPSRRARNSKIIRFVTQQVKQNHLMRCSLTDGPLTKERIGEETNWFQPMQMDWDDIFLSHFRKLIKHATEAPQLKPVGSGES